MTLASIIKGLIPETLKVAYYSCLGYKAQFGHFPNIILPATFNEKIQKSKIFNRDPRIPIRQDKVLVKSHVTEKLGAEYVIPTLWHGTELPPRDQRNWPIPYVIKANHGCGWNIFVRTEKECNWDEIEKKCADWMAQVYGRTLGEWLYGQIKPQLLVEPYISAIAVLPIDYKLWIFNGKVRFILVISGRGTSEIAQAFYDINWVRQPFFIKAFDGLLSNVPPPASLAKMVEAAETLAEDFSFVRVDFYEVNNQPIFGEMTFYPASGNSAFEPFSYDKHVGAFWH